MLMNKDFICLMYGSKVKQLHQKRLYVEIQKQIAIILNYFLKIQDLTWLKLQQANYFRLDKT
jgi:hypothetical protein